MQVGSNKPINKVSAGILAGAIVAIVAWVLQQFGGIELPSGVQGALIVIISGLVSYFVPIAEGEIVHTDGTPVEDNA